MSDSVFALALGTGTISSSGQWLEAYFPEPFIEPSIALVETLRKSADLDGKKPSYPDPEAMTKLANALAAAGEEGQ